MDKLKGKTILVGKEPGQGRLLVSVKGLGKSAAIGTPGCVPACVSRCRAAEGIAHAEIAVDASGNMVITNMKPQNVTYVNGSEIVSKRVTPTSTVELGKDRFAISLPTVIETAKKLMAIAPGPVPPPGPQPGGVPGKPQPSVQKFNISHLEYVWTDLQTKRKAIQEKQKKINLVRTACGLFTLCAMPTIAIFGPVGYALTGVGIVGNLYSFFGLKNDNTSEVLEQMNEDFQDRYVCPNPDCGKFLGNLSYKLLKKQYSMHCPYCKCEYVEK